MSLASLLASGHASVKLRFAREIRVHARIHPHIRAWIGASLVSQSLVSRFDRAERSISSAARILRNAPLVMADSRRRTLYARLAWKWIVVHRGGSLPRAIWYLAFATSGLSHNLYA